MSLPHQPGSSGSNASDDPVTGPSLFLKLQRPGLAREALQIKEFMLVDLAHSVMLTEQGILSQHDGSLLVSALLKLRDQTDNLDISDIGRGSLLFHIEHWLADCVGEELSGRLHTGRSRIDQGTTVRRLYKRNQLLLIMEKLLKLRSRLIELAGRHQHTLMPGYTHMQHAQPWVFGHYLLSFADRLDDDFERILQSYHFTNLSPLGSAGLVGTAWPLNRRRTSDLLGFDGLVKNTRLARDATYAADALSSMSFIMSTLNDLATDLHLWSSFEFGTVELPSDLCGSSSIFPQKKNPEALEVIRHAAGGAVTWLSSALATFRGEGSGDQAMRELPMFDNAAALTNDVLELTSEIIARVTVHDDRMTNLLKGSWATASNLADRLVMTSGLSFRQAHHVVAHLVSEAIRKGDGPETIGENELTSASQQVLGDIVTLPIDAIREALSPDLFVATRKTEGGIAPCRIKDLLDSANTRLSDHKELLGSLHKKIDHAYRELEQVAKNIAGPTGSNINRNVLEGLQ